MDRYKFIYFELLKDDLFSQNTYFIRGKSNKFL